MPTPSKNKGSKPRPKQPMSVPFRFPKGTKVTKLFGGEPFLGSVVGYDSKRKFYKVRYEDGDEEELSENEVRKILVDKNYSEPAVSKSKPKPNAAPKQSFPNGTKVSKLFDGEPFSGSLVEYDSKRRLYKVRYEDGDEEELNESEVKKILVDKSLANKPKPKSDTASKVAKYSFPKGTKVSKLFDGEPFSGSVVEYDSKRRLYKVQYEDGDEEELNENEVKNILVDKSLANKLKPKSDTASKSKVAKYSFPKGTKVSKLFDGEPFSGSIMEYDYKRKLYQVKYEDGDEEELNESEVKNILVDKSLANKLKPKSDKKEHKKIKHSSEKETKPFRFANGTKVSKMFVDEAEGGEKAFKGTLIGFDPKRKFYTVKYEDGDEEELVESEIKTILVDKKAAYANAEVGHSRKRKGDGSSDKNANKRRRPDKPKLDKGKKNKDKRPVKKGREAKFQKPQRPSRSTPSRAAAKAAEKKAGFKKGFQPAVPFEKLVTKKTECSCGQRHCMQMLKEYYMNPDSIYPDNKMKLIFKLSKPKGYTPRASKGGTPAKSKKGKGKKDEVQEVADGEEVHQAMEEEQQQQEEAADGETAQEVEGEHEEQEAVEAEAVEIDPENEQNEEEVPAEAVEIEEAEVTEEQPEEEMEQEEGAAEEEAQQEEEAVEGDVEEQQEGAVAEELQEEAVAEEHQEVVAEETQMEVEEQAQKEVAEELMQVEMELKEEKPSPPKEGKGGLKLQLFNRALEILGLPEETTDINIAIHHFHPKVIKAYNDAVAESEQAFREYKAAKKAEAARIKEEAAAAAKAQEEAEAREAGMVNTEADATAVAESGEEQNGEKSEEKEETEKAQGDGEKAEANADMVVEESRVNENAVDEKLDAKKETDEGKDETDQLNDDKTDGKSGGKKKSAKVKLVKPTGVQSGTFLNFLLPSDLVNSDGTDSNKKGDVSMGDFYEFSSSDEFCCIKTKFQSLKCASSDPDPLTGQKQCTCGLYLNLPIMTEKLYKKESALKAKAAERLIKMRDPFYAGLYDELDAMKKRWKEATARNSDLEKELEKEEKQRSIVELELDLVKDSLVDAKGEDFVDHLLGKYKNVLTVDESAVANTGKNYKFWNDSFTAEFEKIVKKNKCSCGSIDCKDNLREYFANPDSVFAGKEGKEKKLFFTLKKPRIMFEEDSRKGKAWKRHSQYFQRVGEIFDWTAEKKDINIAICHFHPAVIRAFNEEGAKGNFLDYLLPECMVWYHNLGYDFSDEDRFHCLGTNAQSGECRREERCVCKRYLNIPFMTKEVWENGLGPRESDLERKRADAIEAELEEAREQLEVAQSRMTESNGSMADTVADLKEQLIEKDEEIEDLKEEVFEHENEKNSALHKLALLQNQLEEVRKKSRMDQNKLTHYKKIVEGQRAVKKQGGTRVEV